jgi:hypothetical protein
VEGVINMETTLNLHQGFGQCGESLDFKVNLFPAGECYIKIDVPSNTHSCRINSRCNNSDDIMDCPVQPEKIVITKTPIFDGDVFDPHFSNSNVVARFSNFKDAIIFIQSKRLVNGLEYTGVIDER